MKKYIKLILTGLMVGSVLVGCGAKNDEVKVKTEDYVATVNKEKITQSEYMYFLMGVKNNVESMNYVQDEEASKALWAGNLGDKPAEEYAKEIALENAREFKLLLVAAKEAGYKADEEEVKAANEELDTYVATLGAGEEGIKKYEEQYGISVAVVKAINSDFSLVQKYYTEKLMNAQFTDAELKKFYEDNLKSYEQVRVKHVLFMTVDGATRQPLSEEKQEAAKKNADAILARVKAGEDIAALAKEFSEDGGSKDSGGEYTFARGKMVKAFEDWSFGAKVGDAGVVKTEYGYHVIRLEEQPSFELANKDDMKKGMLEKNYMDKMEGWKKDPKNELKKNDEVYNKIRVVKNSENKEADKKPTDTQESNK